VVLVVGRVVGVELADHFERGQIMSKQEAGKIEYLMESVKAVSEREPKVDKELIRKLLEMGGREQDGHIIFSFDLIGSIIKRIEALEKVVMALGIGAPISKGKRVKGG
jgi:hypothetical protein